MRINKPGLLSNVFSCLNRTTSFPALASYPSDLRAIRRIGGAADSANWVFASGVTYGQADNSTCLADSFMAKAKQVGKPHSLQLVWGSSLYICMPVRAIFHLRFYCMILLPPGSGKRICRSHKVCNR